MYTKFPGDVLGAIDFSFWIIFDLYYPSKGFGANYLMVSKLKSTIYVL